MSNSFIGDPFVFKLYQQRFINLRTFPSFNFFALFAVGQCIKLILANPKLFWVPKSKFDFK